MFGWKVLAVLAMVIAACLLCVSWISWWCCNDTLCVLTFLFAMLTGGFGAKLWEEIQENF